MGISVQVSGDVELRSIVQRMDRLADPANKRKLLRLIGAEVESQTHERFRETKRAPDGSKWQAWSSSYAKSRQGSQSLLMASGELDDSIQSFVKGNDAVHTGSPLAYARAIQDGFKGSVKIAAHNRRIEQAFGRALKFPVYQSIKAHTRKMNTPQRQYLGLSSENRKDLLTLIGRFNQELLE
ncbi:phage virion morphogenesis protein [Vibrio sp. LaRot3]|uniref:phage virion morphogenesis protein n=1 Tax=Vibrio sp. LaRot3 TaxID=2998829 RepID=UPI0022CDE0C2|nr:phage virion morphogenesis protein [Vibrio sp. LaRot3]MDA0148852.1 phage virion morphogenesis protein [Vibrio sp. LaRot3]